MRLAFALPAILLLSSCGSDAPDRAGIGDRLGAPGVERVATARKRDVQDAGLRSEPDSRDFDPVRFVFERDLFPSLTDPGVIPAPSSEHGLVADSEVIGVTHGGRARAYPVRLLQHYHAVNDTLGQQPLLLTFCVVCSSGTVWDPTHRGRRLTFGFEGIHAGLPVYYDHQTKTRWFHMTGRAFDGWYAGVKLKPITRARYTTWSEWLRAHPDTDVVRTPADAPPSVQDTTSRFKGSAFMPPLIRTTLLPADQRLEPNELLFGIQEGRFARAYPLRTIKKAGGVLHDRIGSRDVSIWMAPGEETVVAYYTRLGTKALRFEWDHEGRLRDRESQSVWSLDGECQDGPLFGARLEAVRGHLTEWYGWHATYPRTLLHK